MKSPVLLALSLTTLVACGSEPPEGLAVLGYIDIDEPGAVMMEVMADDSDGLNVPRDLDFNPETGDLWIVNRADDSVTIVFEPGTAGQETQHLIDPYALHFMEEVSSIDFGQPGTFGTCQESRNTYNDQAAGNDFMGPSLWSSDLDVFAKTHQPAVDYLTQLYGFYTDLGSHLDMQHETPLCTGIAWEVDNVYWTYDGVAGAIDRVDFGQDHGPGYDDHSDGITSEYAKGEIDYEEGVPNHMVFDHDTETLYIADPAGGRVMALDTTSGTKGTDLAVTEPGTQHYTVVDAEIFAIVPVSAGLDQPTGLAQVGDVLFVTDHGTGFIHAFDLLTGLEIDRFDTGRGADALMGIAAVSETELWVVDAAEDELFRMTPAVEVE